VHSGSPGVGIGAASGPEVVDGLRRTAVARRTRDQSDDRGRSAHTRVRSAAGRQIR